MAKREPLGIKKIEALHYYVHDLERTPALLRRQARLRRARRQQPRAGARGAPARRRRSRPAQAHLRDPPADRRGRARLALPAQAPRRRRHARASRSRTSTRPSGCSRSAAARSSPTSSASPGRRAARWRCSRSPRRSATPRSASSSGAATAPLFPGFVAAPPAARRPSNRFGFTAIDHVTSNFQTMKPALLWLEHVLGFEQLWEIAFHTNDVAAAQKREHGSGLKSVVMWDPHSGVKFANNEPLRPYFKESQINIFDEEHRGDGVQHSRSRSATSSAPCAACARAASSSCRRRAATTTCCPSGSRTLGDRRRSTRDLDDPARARDPGRRRQAAAVPAADLPEGVGRPATTTPRRGRSSSRSSSARATRASAPATSARCSRASSASRQRGSAARQRRECE